MGESIYNTTTLRVGQLTVLRPCFFRPASVGMVKGEYEEFSPLEWSSLLRERIIRSRSSFHHECGTCLTAVVCSGVLLPRALPEHSRQPSPHEATWIVQSPHLPLGRAQSRVRHDDGETSGSDHAARGRELGPATQDAAYERVHHDGLIT